MYYIRIYFVLSSFTCKLPFMLELEMQIFHRTRDGCYGESDWGVFDTLSRMIAEYANSPVSAGEILPKTASELDGIHRAGLSVILQNQEGSPVAHAALWPLLVLPGQNLSVYELGSWFVAEKYRHQRLNGYTIGEEVVSRLLERLSTRHTENEVTAVLATVKRQNSLCGLQRLSLQPISFHRFPLMTALTCSCHTSSEHFQPKSCEYRRRPSFGESPSHEFSELVLQNGTVAPKIPCTLMATPFITQVEARLQSLFHEAAGESINAVTPQTMRRLLEFYQNLGVDI